jgi:D-3-phosphoglycerate dehydrogenase / 2-oxoglutarate reductase
MCDILDGGDFRGVVNAPDLSAIHKVAGARPFVMLCEKIGRMHGQLLGTNKVDNIHINLQGKDVSDRRITEVMKSAVLKGILGALSANHVSYVSAAALADELGLPVSVSMSDQRADIGLGNLVSVDVEVEGYLNMTRSVKGTVFGHNDLRIVEIDGYSVSLPTSGNVFLYNNRDVPGVLKKILVKVEQANVNIAHFSLGRNDKASKVLGALVLDTKLPNETIQEMRKENIITNPVQVSRGITNKLLSCISHLLSHMNT